MRGFVRVGMRILIELSGEQPALARAEALAAIESSGHRFRLLLAEERLLVVQSEMNPMWLAGRLGLANAVSEPIAWGGIDEVLSEARSLDFGDKTFRVRVNSLKGCHNKVDLEKQIGDLVSGRVDLSHPQEEVRLIEGEQHYLCRRLATIDRGAFEKRRVTERSFFFPISIHPRLARVLVNLSRVPEGGLVLDPFCGTGGVLLEAGLVGARLVGGDVRADMVAGCREMLTEYGQAADLHVGDVAEIARRYEGVDAVAMDPPYGRATTTKGESLPSLYKRAFEAVADAVNHGGYIAAILPDTVHRPPVEGLQWVESFPLRVHRTLTRNFVTARSAA